MECEDVIKTSCVKSPKDAQFYGQKLKDIDIWLAAVASATVHKQMK